jgi:hypothetical protein
VREADERIRRVNQVLSSVGDSYTELLARTTVAQKIREVAGNSQLAKDLGRVSAIAHSVSRIQQSLAALQTSSRSDPAAASAHAVDILQELGRRGLSRSPIALLMTDIALGYVGRLQGDALRELDSQLSSITRRLEESSRPLASNRSADCSLLQNEASNRALMERDSSRWLDLVRQCNPK